MSRTSSSSSGWNPHSLTVKHPNLALFSMLIGFFMIMVDTTIVNIAIPTLIRHFDTDITQVLWVNSAYLLAYAVPLLFTGRLGDRFGQQRMFTAGLVVFTLASAWCGFAHNIESLILARTVQGLGASMMTPQTMSMISKIFPPERRGQAMGWWGSVAGVATIVGPLLGGLLVDTLGWEWIFFVNVPVGVLALGMSVAYLPTFPGNPKKLDLLSVLLSGAGLFGVIFGVQEGAAYDWGTIRGPVTVWLVIGVGLALLALFVVRQKMTSNDPLLPLGLFADRNFTLANVAILTVGFTVVAFALPLTIYLQSVQGMDPTSAALVLLPMSLASGVLSPVVGKMTDRLPGNLIALAGILLFVVSLVLLWWFLTPDAHLMWLILPTLLAGAGIAAMFTPLSSLATRSLPMRSVGAGSGVFNTFRQLGGVFASAVIASVLSSRIASGVTETARQRAASLPEEVRQPFLEGMSRAASGGAGEFGGPTASTVQLPPEVPAALAGQVREAAEAAFKAGLSDAAAFSMLIPAALLVFGALACLFMVDSRATPGTPAEGPFGEGPGGWPSGDRSPVAPGGGPELSASARP